MNILDALYSLWIDERLPDASVESSKKKSGADAGTDVRKKSGRNVFRFSAGICWTG